MKDIVAILLFISFLGCKESKTKESITISNESKLIQLFKSSNSTYPNISVHRGGKGLRDYPENCLETIQYVNDSISAVYEIDVAQTKDGKLVLMHDNSIDRTTTGSGLVKDLNYNELKQFSLVDDYGTETNFQIPLFSDVLAWCKTNNIILTIDIKRGVSQKAVVKAINDTNAEDISIIITYDAAQAKSAYALAPNLLLSVSARNMNEYERLLEAEIPAKNMLAFTGTRVSDRSLFQRLHKDNILCMLGTLGNLDKQAEARGDKLYKNWMDLGVDILATDRPFQAYSAINN